MPGKKHGYDSSGGMEKGGGNRTSAKANPLVGHTDTKKFKDGYDPDCDWGSSGKANVVGSRLNKGGDKNWRGSRGNKSGKAMSY